MKHDLSISGILAQIAQFGKTCSPASWSPTRIFATGILLAAVLPAVLVLPAAREGRFAQLALAQSVSSSPTPGVVTTPSPISPAVGGAATPTLTSPTEAPLRFVFPTPAPEAVSAWRPPLYDTPWALTPVDHFYFSRPIAADEVNWPLADYRYGGILPETDVVHTGVDIDAPLGTTVLAAASGRVVWSGYGFFKGYYDSKDPYGLAVAIQHSFGYRGQRLFTVYAHLKRTDVAVGEWVETGQRLGLVGITGNTTGPHLHFEVRLGDDYFFATRNPELWLVPPQGWGVLAGRIMDPSGALIRKKEISVKSADGTHTFVARTYGSSIANPDAYYRENVVISDLPAGDYFVWVVYYGVSYRLQVHIYPGQVSYFRFQGPRNFTTGLPDLTAAYIFPTPSP